MRNIKDIGNSYKIGTTHIEKSKLDLLKNLTLEDLNALVILGINISGLSLEEIYFNFEGLSFQCPLKVKPNEVLKHYTKLVDLISVEKGKMLKIDEIKSVLNIYEQ